MYSVFLVEDEIVIRKGIKNLIEWESYGYKFVGEATDGELAWPMIQNCKPDVVITDIKMPFMDGLALSHLIKKELPNTTIIILSGYDDFSYAKEAIHIGVSQYLLKPLSKKQLIEVLIEVKKQKDETEERQEFSKQFLNEVQEYLSSSHRSFFDSLISNNIPISKLIERAEKLGIDLVAQKYNIILFLLEEDSLSDNYSSVLIKVQEEISRTFSDGKHVNVFNIGLEITAFLVKAREEEIHKFTNLYIERLDKICKSLNDNFRWVIASGNPVSRLSNLSECYHVTRKNLFNNQGYKVKEDLLDYDPNELNNKNVDSEIVEKFLMNGLLEDVESFVDDYFKDIGLKDISSLFFRHYIVLNIRFTVNSFIENLYNQKEKSNIPTNTMSEFKESITTLESSREYTCGIISEALKIRDDIVNSRYRDMMNKVIKYMKENYASEDISLNTVAQIANISTTHFSAVFSQQMGKTFVEYLTELRMEKARELLRCTNLGSSEIAFKAGYNDPHYFSSLFKKVNGCSPRDYRNRKKGGNRK